MMTMSRVSLTPAATGQTGSTVARYITDPEGFTRGLLRAIGEIVKERFQARRQVRRDLVPRTHRGWDFAGLRAATNVLTRDLNTAVIAEEMAEGTRSIYVDYVDYDEIAHHAGIFRPESLASLDGLDRVVATLEKLAVRAPRRYHIVVVSDHGQSQGQPFAAAYGIDLGTLCSQLMAEKVERCRPTSRAGAGRGRWPGTSPASGLSGRVAAKAAARAAEEVDDERRPPHEAPRSASSARATSDCCTCTARERLTLERSRSGGPAWSPGWSSIPAWGSWPRWTPRGTGSWCGADGRHDLDTGVVTGADPLAPFPGHAARGAGAGDGDGGGAGPLPQQQPGPATLDIAAFEPLVGAHGGLGGWQDSAVLLVPRALEHVVPTEQVVGADRLHQVLVRCSRPRAAQSVPVGRIRRPGVVTGVTGGFQSGVRRGSVASSHMPNRSFLAPKVPAVFALFWVAKLLTTGIGETGADYLGTVNLRSPLSSGSAVSRSRCGPSYGRTLPPGALLGDGPHGRRLRHDDRRRPARRPRDAVLRRLRRVPGPARRRAHLVEAERGHVVGALDHDRSPGAVLLGDRAAHLRPRHGPG